MTNSQPSLLQLQAILKRIAEIKSLATAAGLKQKWRESDADFVRRIESELKEIMDTAPAAAGPRLKLPNLKIGFYELRLLYALVTGDDDVA